MNKKSLATIVSLGLLTSVSAGVLPKAAHAEDQTSANTNSSVTFTSGGLNISDAPKAIDFGSHSLTGKAQSYSETTPSSLSVGDYRGQSSEGWQLNAKLQTADFHGMSLSIHPTGAAGTTDYATFTTQTLNGSEAPIAKVTPENVSKEKPDTSFTLGAKIDIPENTPLNAQTYTNTIQWNLVTVPTA